MQPDDAHKSKDQRSLDAAGGKSCVQNTPATKEQGRQQVIQETETTFDQEKVESK